MADPDFQLQFWLAHLMQKNAFQMWGMSLSLMKANKSEADLLCHGSNASLLAEWLFGATGQTSVFWLIIGWDCS